MRRCSLLFLLFIVGLTACFQQPPPTELDFATSPGIFRGTYQTEVDMRASSPNVAFSPDGSLLAMGNGDRFHAVQLWDTATATPLGTLGGFLNVAAVTLTPDGKRVAAVLPVDVNDLPGAGRVWDAESGEVLHKLPPHSAACPKCKVRSLTLSPDGTTLAMLSVWDRTTEPSQSSSEVSLFDIVTGERLGVFSGPPHPLEANYNEISISPDGTRLAAIGTNFDASAHVRVWDMASGQLLGTFVRPTPNAAQANAHMWYENAPVIASYGETQLTLTDAISGDKVMTLPLPADELTLYALYANPDNTRLLGGFQEGVLVSWDLTTKKVAEFLPGESYQAAGFSPDGQYAVAYDAASSTLTLRDPDTLELMKTLVNGAVVSLTLESSATYTDSKNYRVEGTARFGDAPPVPFSGTVQGNETQVYLSPQMGCICPIPVSLRLSFTYGGNSWDLSAGTNDSGIWDGTSLTERAGSSVQTWVHDVQLQKIP